MTGTLAKYFRETVVTTVDTQAKIWQFSEISVGLRAKGFIIKGQLSKDPTLEVRTIRVEVYTK